MSQPSLDLDFVRRQFPPLANGWIMLENAGGSYVPQSVIDRVIRYMSEVQIQPSWDFGPSADAAERIATGRRLMAEMINAEPEEVSIGPSTTLNVYLLMQLIRHWFKPGDEVVVTNQDHEANIGAWRRLADDGVVIREWQIDPVTGELDEAALERLLGPARALSVSPTARTSSPRSTTCRASPSAFIRPAPSSWWTGSLARRIGISTSRRSMSISTPSASTRCSGRIRGCSTASASISSRRAGRIISSSARATFR
jgi:hypothetical protein